MVMRKLILAVAALSGLIAWGATGDVKYDGARVHYESYGAGKEAVVFIHGWTCDLTFWRAQAPFYKAHRSLLIDLPGHGQSDKPEVAYTMDRFAKAVDAVMKDAGVERAILVGHSMAGAVELSFIRLFPEKTKALVLADAYFPQAPKDDKERAAQDARMKLLVGVFRGPGFKAQADRMVEGMFSAKTTAAMRDEIRSKMGGAPQQVMASAMEGMFGVEGTKPGETFKVPAMSIVAASPSRAHDEEQLRVVFPNFRKFEAWEGSGHFLMMESPDRFNAALEDFVKPIGLQK
jgi:pimeloyl-ACP methyl ester carboxylesterase